MLPLGTSKPQTKKKFTPIIKMSATDVKPVLIVGQNPGRQRKGETTMRAWEGNRSSDLLHWVLEDQSNVILTNVCNYQVVTDEAVQEGLDDIELLIKAYDVKRIICLGAFAYEHVYKRVRSERGSRMGIADIQHPSFIVRFNKDREEYKKQILREVRK